jgi:Na+/melibiose symporter-like transporter
MDAVSGTLSYLGLLSVPFLSSRFSARTLLSGGFAYTGFFYALMGLLGLNFNAEKMHRRRLAVGLLIGLAGMPNNGIIASKKVMVGDSTDYMEWYAEKRFGRPIHAEGFLYAAQSLLGNLFNVIRTNIYNIAFGKLGYQANATDAAGNEVAAVQSERTLRGIYLMFVLFGLIGNLLAALTYRFDTYTGKRKEAIYEELTEMRAARATANEKTGN